MNLELTEEQEFFRATTRKFLEAEVPISAVRALYSSADGFDRAWWARGAELGWTSMFVPEPLGGGSLSGRPVGDLAIVAEEVGRLVSPGPLVPLNVVALALAGASEQGALSAPLEDALTGLLSGGSIATWAIAEPQSRWELSGVAATLTVGAEQLRLDGIKSYVESASAADYFLVTACDGDGYSQVLVPSGAPGVTVTPGRSIDMTRRFATVGFAGVRLPVAQLVGERGAAAGVVRRQMAVAICLQCAEMCGVAERTLEATLDYGRERFAFGRPIVSFQAIKHRVADMTVRLEGSTAVTDTLAESIDSDSADVEVLASVAKAYVGDTCLDVVDDCVQITGGIGVTWEHDIHLYNRRALIDRAVYGTPEEHKDMLLQHMVLEEGVRL